MPLIDPTIHVSDVVLAAVLTIVLGGASVVVRRLNRLLGTFEDHPPHRHIPVDETPGLVIYPKGMRPE